jgi:hypothetical protein
VKSFIVDAGSMRLPAFDEKRVSPRVSETIIAPQLPLRTRAFRNVPMSAARASAEVGAV